MTTERKAGHTKGLPETLSVSTMTMSRKQWQALNAGTLNILQHGWGVAAVVWHPMEDGESSDMAAELGRRYNAHADLLAALEKIASSDTTIDRCAIARRVLIDKGLASWLPAKAKGEA